jgi:CRP-like cAMP-binding protein
LPVVFVGFLLYAWLIGAFTTALTQLSAVKNQQRENRDFINQYLMRMRVPTEVRRRVISFVQFTALDDSGPLSRDKLPPALRLQLDMSNHRTLFLKVPFFRGCDLTQLAVLVPLIRRQRALPGDTVLQEGEMGTGLYMIDRGFVRVSVQGAVRELLTHPDFFGEASLVSAEPCKSSAHSVTLSQFMVLARDAFMEFLYTSPKHEAMLHKYSTTKDRETFDAQLENTKLVLGQIGHTLPEEFRQELLQTVHRLEREKAQRRGARELWQLAKVSSTGAAAVINSHRARERAGGAMPMTMSRGISRKFTGLGAMRQTSARRGRATAATCTKCAAPDGSELRTTQEEEQPEAEAELPHDLAVSSSAVMDGDAAV